MGVSAAGGVRWVGGVGRTHPPCATPARPDQKIPHLLCDIETIKRKVVIGLLSPTRAMAMYMLKN